MFCLLGGSEVVNCLAEISFGLGLQDNCIESLSRDSVDAG